MTDLVPLAILGVVGCGACVGWMARRTGRRIQRAREEAYVDGVLDTDRRLRPDAGTGGAQPVDESRHD